jgi:hypothetical protein
MLERHLVGIMDAAPGQLRQLDQKVVVDPAQLQVAGTHPYGRSGPEPGERVGVRHPGSLPESSGGRRRSSSGLGNGRDEIGKQPEHGREVVGGRRGICDRPTACLVAYFLFAIGMHVRARDVGRNLFVNATGMLVLCLATGVFCFLV